MVSSTTKYIGCFGCSFTFGEELPWYRQAYPFQLAYMLGDTEHQAVNFGKCGASNESIVHTLAEALYYPYEFSGIVIQWTEVNRLDLFANNPVTVPGRYEDYVGPIHANIRWADKGVKFIKDYYTDWWDEQHSFERWLRQVMTVQQMLEGKDYVMFNGFGNQELIKKYGHLHDCKYIDTSKFLGWNLGEGAVEWAYGTENMPKGHPGPEGHQRIAQKLYDHIKLSW